eukprot:g194.t1
MKYAVFHFASNVENVVKFEYSVDGSNPIATGADLVVGPLDTGQHALVVSAVDNDGEKDEFPAMFGWEIVKEDTPTQPIVTSSPPTQSTLQHAYFRIESKNETRFKYQISDGPLHFADTGGRIIAENLSPGPHTIRIWQFQEGGVMVSSPAVFTWNVDEAKPWGTKTVQLIDLSEGEHSIQVWATDPLGLKDSAGAKKDFFIDGAAPTLSTITSPPARVNGSDVFVTLRCLDNVACKSIVYKINTEETLHVANGPFTADGSLTVRIESPEYDGMHEAVFNGVDTVENTNAAPEKQVKLSWTRDTTAPDGKISIARDGNYIDVSVTSDNTDVQLYHCALELVLENQDGQSCNEATQFETVDLFELTPSLLTWRSGLLNGGRYRATVIAVDDLNNRQTVAGISSTLLVSTTEQEPLTNITSSPPPISAHQEATFVLYSPDTNKFQWRKDGEKYADVLCPGEEFCSVYIPYLTYGRHRFEARAVREGIVDTTPPFVEWEISHCNDANRNPSQYAEIEKGGALKCLNCPHHRGANCDTLDVEWDGIFANPGWWTSGTTEDNYYKCPYRGACLGGQMTKVSKNGTTSKNTTKSTCAAGFTGVVCSICDQGYYLVDDQCSLCLPTEDGTASIAVVFTFLVAFGLFMFALCRQLRVRDSKSYWHELKEKGVESRARAISGRRTLSSMKKKNKISKQLKIFIGFVQILSVSNSAFKIPWPSGFLFFLRILSPFNFDFLATSGVGCLVEYDFFDSFVTMVCLPLVVVALVFITYWLGLRRHEVLHGKEFTKGMHTAYTNHVIQFAMWITGMNVSRLLTRRKKLNSAKTLARYGFLYDAYRPGAYLWDVWELIRKMFLTGVIVLVSPGTVFQVAVASVTNITFTFFLLMEKPHLPGPGRNLATMASIALTLTMFVGLILITVDDAKEYSALFDISLVVINCSVAIYALFLVIAPLLHSIPFGKYSTKIIPANKVSNKDRITAVFLKHDHDPPTKSESDAREDKAKEAWNVES